MPGGGQVGLVAPPAPPPPDPEPIVVTVAAAGNAPIVEAAAAGTPTIWPVDPDARSIRDRAVVRIEQTADDRTARRSASTPRSSLRLATRLLIVRLVADRAASTLAIRLPRGG